MAAASSSPDAHRAKLLESALGTSGMAVVAVPFTAFDDTAGGVPAVVLDSVPLQAEFAMRHGAEVLLLGGTTAEWPSLTTDEREALARAWRAAIPVGTDGPKLILHIGHNALPDAHRLAIVAAELKYDGVLVSAPSLFVAPTVELQVESVVAALAGVGLPAFYYRYVPLYGDSFDAVELMRALKARLPNIVGIKVSGGEKAETLSELCAETAVILTGAGNTIPGLARGARGIVAYPWESRLFRKVIDAVAADGPEAAEAKAALDIIDRSRAAIGEANVPTETGNYQITGAKAFADASGLRVGPCRLPLPSVPASERAALRDRVAPLLSEGAAEATKG